MADDPQRLRVKRRSCKGSVTKLLTKVEDAMSCELYTINSTTFDESRRLAFNTTLGQLKMKRDIIVKLDSDISDTIKNEEELETELDDADAYLMELEEKIAVLEECVRKASQPPVMPEQDTQPLIPHQPLVAATIAPQMPETSVVKKPLHSVTADKDAVSDDSTNLPIN